MGACVYVTPQGYSVKSSASSLIVTYCWSMDVPPIMT